MMGTFLAAPCGAGTGELVARVDSTRLRRFLMFLSPLVLPSVSGRQPVRLLDFPVACPVGPGRRGTQVLRF